MINNISDVNKAHSTQTKHNEKTPEDVYIGREGTEDDRNKLLTNYDTNLADPNALKNGSEEELAAETDSGASDLDDLSAAIQEDPPIQEAPVQEAPLARRLNNVRNFLSNSHINNCPKFPKFISFV